MDALSTERERQVDHCVTTFTIVHSMIHANQTSEDATKAGSTDKRPITGGIVRSIPNIHRLFESVVKTSEPMQNAISEVAILVPKIRIQKVAFDNACKLLLVPAAKSRQDVDNMIEDPRHPIWKDAIARRNMDKLMTRFYQVCLVTLEHFHDNLNELYVRLRALREQGRRKGTRTRLSWLKRSESPTLGTTEGFPELLQNLKDYNDIFCTLIWQAVPVRSGHMVGSACGELLGRPYANGNAHASYRHFGCIQRASQVLYDTLTDVWTCRDHEVHSLSISLNFDYAKAGAVVQCKDFRFNVTVTSPYFDALYHLVVESAHAGFCTCQRVEEDQCWKEPHRRNKVVRSTTGEKDIEAEQKNKVVGPLASHKIIGPAAVNDVVGFTAEDNVARPAAWSKSSNSSELDVDTAAPRAGDQGAWTLTSPEPMQNKVPDLGLEEDLCRCLRRSSATIKSRQGPGRSCLGFLEARSGLRFLFYYVLRDDYQDRSSHSLDDVLVSASSEHRALSLEDRLRIASFLAAGVLHFNTSSWLPQVWSSKDIHFFDALGGPFLQNQLGDESARGRVCETKKSVATRSSLLSLALVLIELAFSAPWRRLQLREDITRNLSEWERNFLNLMRLSDTVSRELGSRYAKVVQTCLFQGLGAQGAQGFVKAELDEIIYEDIVRELDQCLSAVTLL